MRSNGSGIVSAAVVIALLGAKYVAACPFCSVESQTLTEETRGADAVVLARLVKEAPPTANASDPNSGVATFRIVEVLHGQELLKGAKEIGVVFFGDSNREKTYLVNGIGKDKVDWTTPLPLSPAAIEYVKKLPTVAPNGADRLVFFQDYLEHEDPLLAQDAYDEFARAPYAELRELKPRMKHDKVVKWVTDPEVSPSRRRLYLTMLGICGGKADVPMLESMIASDYEAVKPALEAAVSAAMISGGPISAPLCLESIQQEERRKKLGLDALIACYLILRGPDGLELVENRFLKNQHAEYTHVYSTIMALRFHGDENTGIIPRDRLLASMRLLLNNQDFADQIVLDLSRWEDWSVLDRLVEMFKKSDEKGYIRQPVISYLTVASDQPGEVGARAKAAMAELEKLDPETVKTAKSLIAFGALGRARGMAQSASSGTKPQAAAALSAATDPKQGFGASAADDKADPKQIPDPAGYDQSDQNSAATSAATAKPGDPSKPATATTQSVSRGPVSVHVVSAHMNPLLLVGVPLVGAAFLFGIYWMILRAGAA